MIIEEAFGQVLRKMRKDKNINQEKLAADSNLNRSFISQLEHGRKQPSLNTIFRLAKALGMTPSTMISSVEELIGKQ